MAESFGFILTRHVSSEKTNKFWNEAYNCIRKYYPTETIMLVDDNSNYDYVVALPGTVLKNVFFVQSEYPTRGEILPYYYMYKYKLFNKAVILHDSTYMQTHLDFPSLLGDDKVRLLWNFAHHWETVSYHYIVNDIKNLLGKLNHSEELLELYEKKDNWCGCFGIISILTLDYCEKVLHEKYNFFNLLEHLKTKIDRCCLERLFGIVCCHNDETVKNKVIYGDIHNYINQYCKWTYDYDEYIRDREENKLSQFPIIKTFNGR